MKNALWLLLPLLLLLSSPLYGAPRGAVLLPAEQLFVRDNYYCGYVNAAWVSGLRLPSGWFYPDTARKAKIVRRARASSGSKRSKLFKRAADLRRLIAERTPVCAAGPGTSTPTPTATPSGAPTATPTAAPPTPEPVLASINESFYYTEHSIFLIPPPGQVAWDSPTSWNSLYTDQNANDFVNTFKTHFPDDYFFVTIAANNLSPNAVPRVRPQRRIADGIGSPGGAVGVPNLCLYNIGGGEVLTSAFAVLDHELGHNWAVFLTELIPPSSAHWRSNSTATGQMILPYSDDSGSTFKQIEGNLGLGFTWRAIDSLVWNETGIFSDQDLYLAGLSASFPPVYVLDNPVYHADHTMTDSAATIYTQAWLETNYGVRSPSYRDSEKRFRLGFIYVARDYAEILEVYANIERSINHLVNAEQIDTVDYRFQVPFLVMTKFRGSAFALLADLDGNTTPTLSIDGATYLVSGDGSAQLPFTAWDYEDGTPTVSCLPASANCAVAGGTVQISGLASGSHFFTIKGQDSGGKKAFAHFVIDVL